MGRTLLSFLGVEKQFNPNRSLDCYAPKHQCKNKAVIIITLMTDLGSSCDTMSKVLKKNHRFRPLVVLTILSHIVPPSVLRYRYWSFLYTSTAVLICRYYSTDMLVLIRYWDALFSQYKFLRRLTSPPRPPHNRRRG